MLKPEQEMAMEEFFKLPIQKILSREWIMSPNKPMSTPSMI